MRKKKQQERKSERAKRQGCRVCPPAAPGPCRGTPCSSSWSSSHSHLHAACSAERSLTMITLTSKMCWSPRTAPGEDSGRQHCRIHRRKGVLKEKKKRKAARWVAEAFAQLSAGGTSESSCQHLQDRSEPSQSHPWEEAARPGVCIAFKSRTWPSLNPVLTPKSSLSEGEFGSGGVRHLLLHITAARGGAGLRAGLPIGSPSQQPRLCQPRRLALPLDRGTAPH